MPFDRNAMKQKAAALAAAGVYVGTSSWKYPGWQGMLYDRDWYVYRGRYSEARFEASCLIEYAEVFKTVSVDASYYKFPDRKYLDGLVSQVPEDFQFALKVTDRITIKRFSQLPRFGAHAGQPNDDFLNADLFAAEFLAPCEPVRRNVGLLMFEFSRFYRSDFSRGREFIEALGAFLGRLPSGWPYSVEIRNRNFLHPDYFSTLAKHGVAHLYNNWEGMPGVGEQLDMRGSRTSPELAGARFLLRPGRRYEEAVKLFSPYDQVKDLNVEARQAGARMIRQALGAVGDAGRRTFIYVNNRLEGNALETIAGMTEGA